LPTLSAQDLQKPKGQKIPLQSQKATASSTTRKKIRIFKEKKHCRILNRLDEIRAILGAYNAKNGDLQKDFRFFPVICYTFLKKCGIITV